MAPVGGIRRIEAYYLESKLNQFNVKNTEKTHSPDHEIRGVCLFSVSILTCLDGAARRLW